MNDSYALIRWIATHGIAGVVAVLAFALVAFGLVFVLDVINASNRVERWMRGYTLTLRDRLWVWWMFRFGPDDTPHAGLAVMDGHTVEMRVVPLEVRLAAAGAFLPGPESAAPALPAPDETPAPEPELEPACTPDPLSGPIVVTEPASGYLALREWPEFVEVDVTGAIPMVTDEVLAQYGYAKKAA